MNTITLASATPDTITLHDDADKQPSSGEAVSESPATSLSFDTLNLPEALTKALTKMNFNTPTPVQEQSIPHALEGRDILGSAQTGTGKTGAFGIPLATKLINDPKAAALVLTPTRELAVQVLGALKTFLSERPDIKTALLIGGDSMPGQMRQIRARPRLIVGTPGRINDHLDRGNLMLQNAGYLVLDETDRMLDMGFSIQIEQILKYLPKKRQTLLFSATLPKNIIRMTDQYLVDPVRVSIGTQSKPAENLKQEVRNVKESDKYGILLDELDTREGSVIIFVKTKRGADSMASELRKDNYRAEAVHGDLHQSKRDRVIKGFRNQKHRILVATDIAARGLDIPHIEHVINFDLPQCPEDYIHRIGRTARAGAEGSALCLISPVDKSKWYAIERLLNPEKAGNNNERNGGGRNRNGGANRRNGGGGFKGKSSGKNFGGNRSSSERREGGDRFEGRSRPERREGGDRFEGRSRPERREGGDRFEGRSRPERREGGDRFEGRSRPERREGGDRFEGRSRPERREGGDRSEGRSRPERREGGDRFEGRSRPERREGGDRSEGRSRPERREGGDRFEGRSRPERREAGNDDRPQRRADGQPRRKSASHSNQDEPRRPSGSNGGKGQYRPRRQGGNS